MFLKKSFSSVDDDELFGLGEGEADGVCARAPPADKKIASVIMPKWHNDILLLRMVVLLVMDGFARNVDETNTVRNRSRQRPGSVLEITRLLAQAVPYQIDSSTTIWTLWQGLCYRAEQVEA